MKILFNLQINEDEELLPDVNLVLRYNDTKGDTVLTTRVMTDMLCDGVSAFFGPESSCYVESIVAQSRNIPMISYVSNIPIMIYTTRGPHNQGSFRVKLYIFLERQYYI